MSNTLTVKLQINKPHTNQAAIVGGVKRFNVINSGRRFGKSELAKYRTHKPLLDGYPVAYYAPTYKMLSEMWREVKNIYALITANKNETEKRLELVTGGVLDMWSLDDPDSSRGRKYKRVLIDEAAKVKKLEEAWLHVIRPTLADFQGDADFYSTPKGLNYYHVLWTYAGEHENWTRWHYTTYDNPYILPVEIDEMRGLLPERVFRQEIMAEFIEDGAFFQNVDKAAVVDGPDSPDNHEGHYLVMAVDWAISQDFTVIGVGCRDCNRAVDWDRFNKIDFTYQRERLYMMADRWNIAGCLPERNSIGQPNIEIIRDRVHIFAGPDGGAGFNTSATTKPPLIMGLAKALEYDSFQVPRVAADELRAYEVETMASGHPKFGAPEGLHDDWVIMLALLWRAMSTITVQTVENPFYD